ncbi:MAG TPA: hypothetical protein VKM55_05515 [Candidatus Lokiarchaeia archaeon]|nr:hypothetical protein [Candidatus Lokiarchaeia archaeon]
MQFSFALLKNVNGRILKNDWRFLIIRIFIPTIIMFSLMKREFVVQELINLKIVHPCCVKYRKIEYKLYAGRYMQEGDGP